MKNSFVYRWRNKQTKVWYIGYHKGSTDDGYICSSKSARPLIEQNPEEWTRKILRTGTKEQMIVLERRILQRLNARKNPKSLNLHNGNGHTATGRKKGQISNSQHPDLHPTALIKLDQKQLIDHLLTEVDLERKFLLHKFIFKRMC